MWVRAKIPEAHKALIKQSINKTQNRLIIANNFNLNSFFYFYSYYARCAWRFLFVHTNNKNKLQMFVEDRQRLLFARQLNCPQRIMLIWNKIRACVWLCVCVYVFFFLKRRNIIWNNRKKSLRRLYDKHNNNLFLLVTRNRSIFARQKICD